MTSFRAREYVLEYTSMMSTTYEVKYIETEHYRVKSSTLPQPNFRSRYSAQSACELSNGWIYCSYSGVKDFLLRKNIRRVFGGGVRHKLPNSTRREVLPIFEKTLSRRFSDNSKNVEYRATALYRQLLIAESGTKLFSVRCEREISRVYYLLKLSGTRVLE